MLLKFLWMLYNADVKFQMWHLHRKWKFISTYPWEWKFHNCNFLRYLNVPHDVASFLTLHYVFAVMPTTYMYSSRFGNRNFYQISKHIGIFIFGFYWICLWFKFIMFRVFMKIVFPDIISCITFSFV